MLFVRDIFHNMIEQAKYAFDISSRYIANIMEFMLPYLMFWVAYFGTYNRLQIIYLMIIPILFYIVIVVLRAYANQMGKGPNIPIPYERFTEVNEDGEVTMEYDRIQELMLYTADLEDYLERKGLLKRRNNNEQQKGKI